jgi:hypothetical protein
VFTRADEPLEADDWLRTMEQKFELIECSDYQKPVFAAQQLRGAAGAWWGNHLAAQPAGHRVTWAEFRTAFRAHFIPEGIMIRKLEEFLALKQGDQTVMQYVGRFNHLSQYAANQINSDRKKQACFMRGLNSKIRTMMTGCLNVTYHEAVDIALLSEEEYRKHKEAKKKRVSYGPSGGNQKRHKIVYHPQNHFRPPFRPPQFQARQQAFVHLVAALSYPRQPNALGIRPPLQQGNNINNYPCYNYGKIGHFSSECPYPRQYN